MIVGFVVFEVEDVVVAAGTEAFGVDLHFSLASFAGCLILRLISSVT